MSDKETALQQVDTIFNVIQSNFKAVISGTQMIVTGSAVAAIPLIELIFSVTLDPLIMQATSYSGPIIFALRTIFYWTFFVGLAHLVSPGCTRPAMHPILKKIWALNKYFPIIPLSTAATMAISGYGALISPIILMQIGCLMYVLGLFTSWIVKATAWSFICLGLVGIYLSTLSISHLWIYLVVFEGIALIIMGLILNQEQRECKQ